MTTKLLFNADAAAELLSTTKRRVHELRRCGQLTAVLDGREMKFTYTELQRYADSLQAFEPKSFAS